MLRDKVIIITGAANGLGKGIAQACHSDGANVVISDLDQASCEKVVDELVDRALAVPCDVCSDEAQKSVIDATLGKWGRLDGLVNNAGVNFAKPFMETSRQDWSRVIETDLEAVFFFHAKGLSLVARARRHGIQCEYCQCSYPCNASWSWTLCSSQERVVGTCQELER